MRARLEAAVPRRTAALLAVALLWIPSPASLPAQASPSEPGPATLVVGRGEAYASVGAALERARDGDTVRVRPGVYRESLLVEKEIVLLGEPGAVLHGGGRGTVLTVTASARVAGLEVRGSGRDLSREDAGLMVLEADDVVVEDLRMEDVLFGIYLKESDGALIRGNQIVGKPLPVGERGDGIRLWYCRGGLVAENRLDRTRDLVIWFSSDLEVRDNVVENSRYGLHYMYSDHNRFEDNVFRNNHVGAFLMYSAHIEFRGNRFLEAYGPTGVGLGIKDSDDIRAEGNAFIGNGVGITLDNSPTTAGVTNHFRDNTLAYNVIGVSLLPSVRSNAFVGNAFVENGSPVSVSGGGDALGNRWRANYWSDYAGFDEDRDATGDTPYRLDRIADALYARHPELRWFAHSPAAGALELLGRLFPLLKPRPIVIDSLPRLGPGVDPGTPEAAREPAGGGRATWATLLLAAGAAAFLLTLRLGRPARLRA